MYQPLSETQLQILLLVVATSYVWMGFCIHAALENRRLRRQLRAVVAEHSRQSIDTSGSDSSRYHPKPHLADSGRRSAFYRFLQTLKQRCFSSNRCGNVSSSQEPLHHTNHSAIPSASQEVEHDAQSYVQGTTVAPSATGTGEDSTESRPHDDA